MAKNFDLNIIFKAIDKLSLPLSKMRHQVDQFSKKTKSMAEGLNKFGTSMLTKVTLPLVGAGIVGVKSFAEQEQALLKMNNAIKLTGREGQISSESLLALSKELQQVTKYEDDASLNALALVQSMGNLNEKQLKTLLPRMQDLASGFKDMDLEQVASLMGKVFSTDNTAMLKRYGLNVEKTGNKQQLLLNLITEIDKKFKGVSKESAKGFCPIWT